MKSMLRSLVINAAALYLTMGFIPGASYNGGAQTIFTATIVLSVINRLIKPIISLLLLPINLITLGSFRWLVNVITLFLLTLIMSQLTINKFVFPGLELNGFIVPEIEVSRFWSFVISSASISLINSFLFWLAKGEK